MLRTLTIALLLPAAAAAGGFSAGWPVDCTLGESCFFLNFFDRDPGPATLDHLCASQTYDGHDGTDIAVPTLAAMQAGVEVRAAAPGKVLRVRDGEPDGAYLAGEPLDGRECGNGVVIDHGKGWTGLYCHLRKGSVQARPGQMVTPGTVIGQVGLSGKTEHPHLHFELQKDGQSLDPFNPEPGASCATDPAQTLWDAQPATPGGGLLELGFANAVPDYKALKLGQFPATPNANAPALVLWAYGHGARAGDVLRLEISGPLGFRFAHDATLEHTQALFMRAGGRKRPAVGWSVGDYQGRITLIRDEKLLQSRAITLRIGD